MLRPSTFIYISLIFSFCHGELLGPLMSPTPVSSNSIISPDRFNKNFPLNDRFVIADFQVEGNNYEVTLRLEHWIKQISEKCRFNVTTKKPVAKVGATSMRRLESSRKVVLTWYDEIYESGKFRRRPHIIAMDFEACRTNDLGLQDIFRDPIVRLEDDGGFSVYLAYPDCERFNEICVIHYDEDFLTSHDRKPFEIDFDFSTLKIEDVYAGDMLVRGFDNWNTYKVMLIGRSIVPKMIASWEHADSQMTIVTSTWAFCWVQNPNVDTAVNCSQFDIRGKIVYSKVTEFGVPVTPLAVQFLENGRLFLLTGQTSCGSDKSCWKFTWTIVSDDNSVFGVEEFGCTGDRESLLVSRNFWRENKMMHYWYLCKNENRYAYNENHFES